jgi:hypothetical protein
MYIMCVKVIAVPSQDSGRSCILCVLRLSLYQARTVSGHVCIRGIDFSSIPTNFQHRYMWTGPYDAPLFFLFS